MEKMQSSQSNMQPKGIFITFEGGDGAGKSTHIRFLANSLREHSYEVLCLREPGGTDIGEQLRYLVLDPKNKNMCSKCELLIYEAARAQIVAEVIRPALEKGVVVLCDRFADSTVAYQAYGRGLCRDFVEEANLFAADSVWPNRTIVMSCANAEESLQRATRKNGADRIEQAGVAFHSRVNKAFYELAQKHPERVRLIESQPAKSETSKRIFHELADLFPYMKDVVEDKNYFSILDKPKYKKIVRDISAKKMSIKEKHTKQDK